MGAPSANQTPEPAWRERGYITRAKLISGNLQTIQEKLTETILGGAKLDAKRWLN